MAKSRYEKRLEKDLDRWIEKGFIAANSRTAILGDVADAPTGWSASGALAILGASLLALAALTFVAANWADIGNLLRLTLIFATLWLAFLGAGWAFKYGHPSLGHALALLGAALFGVAIVLVAQIFNMSSWRYTVIAITALGALVTAIALPSRPVLILACLLGSTWVWFESFNPYAPGVIWRYLPLWAISMMVALRLQSLVSSNLLAIGLYVWIAFLLWDYGEAERISELQSSAILILSAGGTAMLFSALRDRGLFGFGALTGWGLSLALMVAFAQQFSLDRYERYVELTNEADIEADRWLEVSGTFSSDFYLLAGSFLALLIASSIWRLIAQPQTRFISIAAILAGLAAFALPILAESTSGGAVLLLRVLIGTLIFIVSIALIVFGSREGQRFSGGAGITLFIAQTLYVYGETFGGLLDTSLFFLIGGLLLFGLSIGVIRLNKMAKQREASL